LTKEFEKLPEMIRYHTNHLTRIYPKGLRVDSSNYDPFRAWNFGAQLIALNHQTGDPPMWFNSCKFLDNGGCGYVLKPRPNVLIDALNRRTVPEYTLSITVISAFQLPTGSRDYLDPFVKVRFFGFRARYQYRTKVISENAYNPEWNETFRCPVFVPATAMVLFQVMSSGSVFGTRDEIIGHYVLPVHLMLSGIKSLPLNSKDGKSIGSTLLVHQRVEKRKARYLEET